MVLPWNRFFPHLFLVNWSRYTARLREAKCSVKNDRGRKKHTRHLVFGKSSNHEIVIFSRRIESIFVHLSSVSNEIYKN